MYVPSERLEALGVRVERLVLDPDAISAPLTRFFRPVLYRIGWEPDLRRAAFDALVAACNAPGGGHEEGLRAALDASTDELERNVRQIERATIVNRRVLTAYGAWLRRIYEVLVNVERALQTGAMTARRHRQAYLPPMTLAAAEAIEEAVEAAQDSDAGDGAEPHVDGADPARLLELQLDTVDELLAAANAEDRVIGRRRRLLTAARQLLLETSAALDISGGAVEERLQYIAGQVTQLNRLQALGLREDVALLHQARSALARGERERFHAALSILGDAAAWRGDVEAHGVVANALSRVRMGGRPVTDVDSLDRSATEVLGADVVNEVRAAYQHIERHGQPKTGDTYFDDMMTDIIDEYVTPGAARATLANALMVDGCVDVGGAMAPVRVTEQVLRPVLVRHPMPDLKLVSARGPEDVPNAVMGDPRLMLLDLAAGRLLTRRYVRMEAEEVQRTVLQGEVRVYLLDGSGSMIGARARMRDAILTAELATLARRLRDPQRRTHVVLYYRYFNHELGPVQRVDTAGGALEAIGSVLRTLRRGGTDLQGALLASMAQVRDADLGDADLKRAQIVLITDGEAPFDLEAVEEARRGIAGVPLGVSVIALGQENDALRKMVVAQQRRGDRAFYHFLPDHYLSRVSRGRFDDGAPVHLPRVPQKTWEGEALQTELGALMDDLARLTRAREADVPAQRESGHERFLRWFPEPSSSGGAGEGGAVHPSQLALWPEEGTLERVDLESAFVLLATVVEVMETLGDSPAERQADGVAMLDRLLPHARLTPGRYQELLRLYPQALAPALEQVHATAAMGLWARLERPRSAE